MYNRKGVHSLMITLTMALHLWKILLYLVSVMEYSVSKMTY